MSVVNVNTESQSYKVIIAKLQQIKFNTRVLLVTTKSVEKLFLDYVISLIDSQHRAICVIPDGEEHKNLQTIETILNCAFEAKLNRKSVMIALGGGVVTDIVGFASGIYQRGIDFISIPTTLLAMVDASVGGKCGVNSKYGKNLIGLFHQPSCVYVDSVFLYTLPKRELHAGIAEIIKIFACFEYKNLQDFDIKNLDSYIQKSIELKAIVVQEDEKEKSGKRALLNYGHTFGHAIELETEFKQYLHGEAVSMGIVMANRLSVKLGLLQEEKAQFIEQLLQQHGLPTHYKIKDTESFYQSFFLDKKSLDSKLHFILLESKNDVVEAKVHNKIPKETILEVLYEFS